MPNILLENENIRVEIYNPTDPDDPHFYTRYNYCGYIKQICNKRSNIEILGRPTDQFHPFHGEGFPDEFEMPLFYDAAKQGESFLKIGVGIEQKISEDKYTNWDMHPILEKAKVEVEILKDQVKFIQSISLNSEIGYRYIKTIALNEQGFSINHSLENTGTENWKTLWYSHCFLALGDNKSDVELKLTRNCILKNASSHIADLEEHYEFNSAFDSKGECFNWNVSPKLPNYQEVVNKSLNYRFTARGDYPYDEAQVYINDRIVSAEPKVNISLSANEKFIWSTDFTF